MEQPAHDLPELLYLYDPLCSWCYGMTPVIQKVQRAFAGRINVSVLNGGLITGEQVGPISATWDELQTGLPLIQQVTGVRFGEAFRQLGAEGRRVLDSELPCRALATFRQLDMEDNRTVHFAHAIQHAFFAEGQDLNEAATYDALVTNYGLDAAEFQRQLALPATADATRQEFAAVARIGVQGFPTSILRINSQGYVLARGFQPYEAFAAGLEQALQQGEQRV